MMLTEGDQMLQSFKQMLVFVGVAMTDRVVEKFIFGGENIISGASSDVFSALKTTMTMVTKYGFSKDTGVVYYGRKLILKLI